MTRAQRSGTTPAGAAVRRVDVQRHPDGGVSSDLVAAEEPLEVRLGGEPFAVIMRTPGRDRDLALGFLFAEGVIDAREAIAQVDVRVASNTVDVALAAECTDVLRRALAERRLVRATASCGACGRRTLAALGSVPAIAPNPTWTVGADVVVQLPVRLGAVQRAFDQTGGLHAAALFDRDGALVASAEDVGRHNAVDKLVGEALDQRRLPLTECLLMVSGRTSFEIVQKAALAGIPMVAAVSAPSSLAVTCAREAGITLLGFVRSGRFNVYTHPARVVATAPPAQ
jgi:FdhD protein